jgi:hypothetical protein
MYIIFKKARFIRTKSQHLNPSHLITNANIIVPEAIPSHNSHKSSFNFICVEGYPNNLEHLA